MMFNSETERSLLLTTLLSELDLKDLSRWDETKILQLRGEIRDCLRKPSAPTKVNSSFDIGLKIDNSLNPMLYEDIISFIALKFMGLTIGESIGLSFCLYYSQNKILSLSAKKLLKTKLPEIRNQLQLSEIHEEIRSGLFNLLQTDDELRSPEISGAFQGLMREAYGNSANSLGFFQNNFKGNTGGISSMDLGLLSRSRHSIASILEEYGGQVSSSAENFRKVLLSTATRIDEEQLAGILVAILPRNFVGSFDDQKSIPWNYEVVAETLQIECRGLNWNLVVKFLDNPKLCIRSETDYQILARLIVRLSGSSIPVAGLLQNLWNNRSAQFAILALSASAPRNIIDFSQFVSQEQVLSAEGINVPPNFSWMCQPLYVRLLDLANNGFAMEVMDLLMKAASQYPEYVLTSLSQVQDQGVVRAEILQRLLPLFTGVQGARPTSLAVMRKLYSTNSDLLFRLCFVAFKRSSKAAEVLNIENIVKSLGPQFLRRLENDPSIEDLLSLWCIKADRQELNLEEKLSGIIDSSPKNVRVVANFVKQHIEFLRSRSIQPGDGILSVDSFAALFRILQSYPAVVTLEEMKSFILTYNQYQQSLQPSSSQHSHNHASASQREFSNRIDTSDVTETSRLPPGPETEEIEGLANAYFQKIYTADISITDIVILLRQFKSSSEKREQELFRCMVHNLFDEYRFFHKYPEKELQITARLFGALIQHQLVSSITLGIALRYVLEALRKDPEIGEGNDKMFRFGQISLDQFRSRIGEWPQYCSHLIQIPHLSRHNPDLFQEAQRALSGPQQMVQQPPSAQIGLQSIPAYSTNAGAANYDPATYLYPSGASLGVSQSGLTLQQNSGLNPLASQFSSVSISETTTAFSTASSSRAANSLIELPIIQTRSPILDGVRVRENEIDRMLIVNQPVVEDNTPADNVRDSIHFIINNVAKNNLEAKAAELKDILRSDFYAWFANYLVEKRVSSQPNLHPLYIAILDAIDSSSLNKLVVDSTLFYVTKFLSSQNITSSTSERSVLRHFGMWLGHLTLAKNRPLLQRRINLKSLLFWGYETGRLIAVCSFVAKVIEGVKDSKVFRPPNPWLMAILGVLKELFEIEDLKLNIKFEVQVLCKSINIKIEDIPKSNSLSICQSPLKDQKNPDFIFKSGSSAPSVVGTGFQGHPSTPIAPAVNLNSSQPNSQPSIQLNASGGDISKVVDNQPDVSTVSVTGPTSTNLNAADPLNLAIVQVVSNVSINGSITFFSANPSQRKIVSVAVERGIREIAQAAVDRSVALATTTTKQLVLKDFANESNEDYLKTAAHQMATSLAGSISVAICKEPLRISISNHLRTLLNNVISDQSLLEHIVQVCSNENLDAGCEIIEKASIEKANSDISEALSVACSLRHAAKESGTVYFDSSYPPLSSKYSSELQDLLKFSLNGLSSSQMQLYDIFQRAANIDSKINPGNSTNSPSIVTAAQALDSYHTAYSRLDQSLKVIQTQARDLTLPMLGDHEISQMIRDMSSVTQRIHASIRSDTATTFAETIFSHIFDSVSNPYPLRYEVMVAVMETIKDASGNPKLFSSEIIVWLTKFSVLVNEDLSRRVYRHVLLLLTRAKLVKASDIDNFLLPQMDNGSNMYWLELSLTYIKQCVAENICSVYDFTGSIEAINQMRPNNVNVRKTLQKWLLEMKAIATAQEDKRAASSAGNSNISATNPASAQTSAAQKDNSAKNQVANLLDRWLNIWSSVNDQIFGQYIQLMHQYGVLRTEDAADKFFRLATDICVEANLKSAQANENGSLTYTVIDALSKLFLLLVRLADKESNDSNVRANLLARILNSIARSLIEDHELKKGNKAIFDQRPYLRLLGNMSHDLGTPLDDKQDVNPGLLALVSAHAQVYISLQPSLVPSFAFAWLQLISRKSFMPYLVKNQKGWATMHKLVTAMLMFLQPFLKSGQLFEPIKKLYKGVLRVMLILLHDFPEFLCDFHLSFCDIIPINCVQLRNLILSAFPRSMRLPDPFTPNLKIENLPETTVSPRILIDYTAPISAIRSHLDNYLNSQNPPDLPSKLLLVLTSPAGGYNISFFTSLVVHVGVFSISQALSKTVSTGVELLKFLTYNLDSEGRYIMLNSIANQLRYPNSHTCYFSAAMLTLFLDTDNEYIQEQITRVLLERLIANRPHPWGLLVTFIELIKGTKYSFWRKSFTKTSPEIERVFESMAKSCIGPAAATIMQQQLV